MNKKLNIEYSARYKDWFYSLSDIMEYLTDSQEPIKYLKDLRQKDKDLDKYLNENKHTMELYLNNPKRVEKMPAIMTKDVVRLLESINTPKANEIKEQLIKDSTIRVVDLFRPKEASLKRSDFLRSKGFSEKWINQNKK